VAFVAAAILMILGSLAQVYFPALGALVALLMLDVVALIWLRRVLHLGLIEESLEIEVGPDIVCANCGKRTPLHTFCINCGIALKALPKAVPRRRTAPIPPAPTEGPA
jgi:hypothetical protein